MYSASNALQPSITMYPMVPPATTATRRATMWSRRAETLTRRPLRRHAAPCADRRRRRCERLRSHPRPRSRARRREAWRCSHPWLRLSRTIRLLDLPLRGRWRHRRPPPALHAVLVDVAALRARRVIALEVGRRVGLIELHPLPFRLRPASGEDDDTGHQENESLYTHLTGILPGVWSRREPLPWRLAGVRTSDPR